MRRPRVLPIGRHHLAHSRGEAGLYAGGWSKAPALAEAAGADLRLAVLVRHPRLLLRAAAAAPAAASGGAAPQDGGGGGGAVAAHLRAVRCLHDQLASLQAQVLELMLLPPPRTLPEPHLAAAAAAAAGGTPAGGTPAGAAVSITFVDPDSSNDDFDVVQRAR